MSAAAATISVPNESATGPAINPWIVAIVVTLATFMELLDTAIATVALPHIAGGLAVSYDESTWVLTSYLVSNAVVLPLSAWLSRVFGRKRYYMTCVLLFTVSSLLCGLAPSLGLLIFFRVLQGVGGGGLAPVEQAILVDTFPPNKRPAAFALYSMAIVTAPAIGPPLGGWITDSWSWRWVFFINIPIGILSLILTKRLVSDPPEFTRQVQAARRDGKLKIDGLGIVLIALGFACLEVVLDRGQTEDWFESNFILIFFSVAVVALVIAAVWEWRHPDPVVEIRLLGERNFAIANFFYFLFGFTLFGSTVLIPQMLQSLYGYTATDAGLVLRSRSDGHRSSCTGDGQVAAKGWREADDRGGLLHLRSQHVVLREFRSGHRLQARGACTRSPRAWHRTALHSREPARIFILAKREEQQSVQFDESISKPGSELWHRVCDYGGGAPHPIPSFGACRSRHSVERILPGCFDKTVRVFCAAWLLSSRRIAPR